LPKTTTHEAARFDQRWRQTTKKWPC
jgi:hypothetical protein